MKSVLIHELQPYGNDYKIRVRVCRLWRGKRIKPERNDGLHCVVDERGDAIHGIVSEVDYHLVSRKIKQGEVYSIFNFFVRKSQLDYKVVDNSIQAHFNARTFFIPLQDSLPKIPEHRFYLLDYNQLEQRIGNNTLLTDLFGCVKSIMPVEEVRTKDGMESKCEINLQNLRREDIRITLWGDAARKFDIETIENLPPPVLMVMTSLKVRMYKDKPAPSNTNNTCIFINPQIAQAELYKAEFSKPADNVKKLATPYKQMTAAEVQKETKITVHDLNKLNPDNYKDKMVYCKASICRFSTHQGWWYEACPHCYRQLKIKENSDLRICLEHNMQVPLPCYRVYVVIEDPNNEATLKLMGKQAEQLFGTSCKDLINKNPYVTQETVPEEIEQTKGQIHTFQIKINETNDFIIKGIFPNMGSLPQTEDEPTTSTPAHPLPDKKRVLDISRRELFNTESEKKLRSDMQEKTSSSSAASMDQSEKQKIA